MTEFTDKSVFVLGGSRGIGAAIVRRFAGQGATVTFSYAGSTDAAKTLTDETGATAVRSDAADRAAVIAVVQDRGPIDILVVNAGLFISGDPLALDADAIDRMIDINIRAPYHAAVEAARQMPDGGRIIVIGSTNGDRMPFAGAAAYAMTKSALQGMARGLARDFGARGITVNIVQPGPTDTDMNPGAGPISEFMHGHMAIGRHVKSDEVAAMVVYLAGSQAAMVTGAMHTIDGGLGS